MKLRQLMSARLANQLSDITTQQVAADTRIGAAGPLRQQQEIVRIRESMVLAPPTIRY